METMNELSFYIPGFFENASVECIKNIRKFYPDSSIIISSDDGPDYYEIAKKYNCQFQYYPDNLGYPEMPHGYKKEKALRWMERFYVACVLSKGTHIMCAEDGAQGKYKYCIVSSCFLSGVTETDSRGVVIFAGTEKR